MEAMSVVSHNHCVRCCTADRALPTGEPGRRGRERERERRRKAEPASAAAVTVKEGRRKEGADFDTADSPPQQQPLLVCDILLQKCEIVVGLLYSGHRIR